MCVSLKGTKKSNTEDDKLWNLIFPHDVHDFDVTSHAWTDM